MAAVDIVLVGGVDEGAAVVAEGNVIDDEVAGGKVGGRPTAGGD